MNFEQTRKEIEQSLQRLARQGNEVLTLPIGTKVQHIASQRGAVSRQDTSTEMSVKISDLIHLHVGSTESSGFCIRTIFVDQLLAAVGENADLILAWANKASRQDPAKKIPPFPKAARFQHVQGPVRIHNGDIIPA